MKRSRFSDEEIIAIRNEQEAGMATAEVCHLHGISGATFYKRKAKYGGLEVSKAKRLRSLEDENAKLKKLPRIYPEEGLKVRRRGGRKRALGTKAPMTMPQGPNQRWSSTRL